MIIGIERSKENQHKQYSIYTFDYRWDILNKTNFITPISMHETIEKLAITIANKQNHAPQNYLISGFIGKVDQRFLAMYLIKTITKYLYIPLLHVFCISGKHLCINIDNILLHGNKN